MCDVWENIGYMNLQGSVILNLSINALITLANLEVPKGLLEDLSGVGLSTGMKLLPKMK